MSFFFPCLFGSSNCTFPRLCPSLSAYISLNRSKIESKKDNKCIERKKKDYIYKYIRCMHVVIQASGLYRGSWINCVPWGIRSSCYPFPFSPVPGVHCTHPCFPQPPAVFPLHPNFIIPRLQRPLFGIIMNYENAQLAWLHCIFIQDWR